MHTEMEAALSNDDNSGHATGNWRSHLLIDCSQCCKPDCAQCYKPMASHSKDKAVSNACIIKGEKE